MVQTECSEQVFCYYSTAVLIIIHTKQVFCYYSSPVLLLRPVLLLGEFDAKIHNSMILCD